MSRSSFTIVVILLTLLMGLTALRIGLPDLFGVDAVSADYMIFHQVGELSRLGRVLEAYDAEAFRAYQEARTGSSVFMTWTYPPQFNILMHPLSALPPALGYLVFTLGSFVFFIWAMFRLAPEAAQTVLLLCLPAMTINLLTGQNGFLTAGLMALTASLAMRGSVILAGLCLGLLTYKPHLGLGLGLAALLKGGFRFWGAASLTLIALLAFGTWAYGTEIWQALLTSVETSRKLLETAGYKLERMNTIFSLTASLGLPAGLAMSLQMGAAMASLACIALAALKGWSLRALMSLGMLSGTLTSPYAYDYDLCLLAPALALAWPAIQAKLSRTGQRLMGAAVLWAGGYGLATVILAGPLKDAGIEPLALGGLCLLTALALCTLALWRAEST